MIGWKVITKNYDSVFARGKAQIHYPLNVKVSAPDWLAKMGYYPTFFKTKKEAENYAGLANAYLVVRVKASKIIKKLPHLSFLYYLARGSIRENPEHWPKGTLMAKYITRLTD